jgi:hypothetical protein
VDSSTAAAWWNVWINLGMASATALAAVFAYLAYRKQHRRDLTDQAEISRRLDEVETERRTRAEAERRAQAETVCVWADVVNNQGSRVVGMRHLSALIRNASNLPVHEVGLEFSTDGGSSYTEHLDAIGPSTEPVVVPVSHAWLKPMNADERDTVRVSMTFRDAAGRSWRRTSTGQLALIDHTRRIPIGMAVERDEAASVRPVLDAAS